MRMMNNEESAPERLVIRPLSYILELGSWAQARAARPENLKPLHVTFLRRAAWNGLVSFDHIQKETGLPRYTISLAAARLEKRRFGKVKPDEKDKRWKWLHITLLGRKCYERIDRRIARYLSTRDQSLDAIRYYNFVSHLWSAALFLPHSDLPSLRESFPGAISGGSQRDAAQRQLLDFIERLGRDASLA
jgi:DNA-binding MarR family transcriptional regulator